MHIRTYTALCMRLCMRACLTYQLDQLNNQSVDQHEGAWHDLWLSMCRYFYACLGGVCIGWDSWPSPWPFSRAQSFSRWPTDLLNEAKSHVFTSVYGFNESSHDLFATNLTFISAIMRDLFLMIEGLKFTPRRRSFITYYQHGLVFLVIIPMCQKESNGLYAIILGNRWLSAI